MPDTSSHWLVRAGPCFVLISGENHMKTLSSPADAVQEPKAEKPETKGTYRAPRLVTLGTTVDLVQGYVGTRWDGGRGYWQH